MLPGGEVGTHILLMGIHLARAGDGEWHGWEGHHLRVCVMGHTVMWEGCPSQAGCLGPWLGMLGGCGLGTATAWGTGEALQGCTWELPGGGLRHRGPRWELACSLCGLWTRSGGLGEVAGAEVANKSASHAQSTAKPWPILTEIWR